MTEIELRGPIKNKKRLSEFLKSNFKKDFFPIEEIVIFFKVGERDFRLKWNEAKTDFEFVYKNKIGDQRVIREEYSVKINKTEINSFLNIIKFLGIKQGFISQTKRFDFDDQKIHWSFKLGSVIGDYWEAEASQVLMKDLNNDYCKVSHHIREIANLFNLDIWSDNQFKNIRQLKWKMIKPKSINQILILLNEQR